MYKHMIDESLQRARKELEVCQRYHRTEEIRHIQRRMDSLLKLRENAPEARFQPITEEAKPYKPILDFDEYLDEIRGL